MSHQLLDRSNVIACFKQVGGESIPEYMTADMFDHVGLMNSFLDGPLKNGLMDACRLAL